MQISHPKKTRCIAEARIKSDRVDSEAIAELVRCDSLPPSYMPPPEIAELREKALGPGQKRENSGIQLLS